MVGVQISSDTERPQNQVCLQDKKEVNLYLTPGVWAGREKQRLPFPQAVHLFKPLVFRVET